ncbi:MAG TPA: hypothetical protein VFE19_06740 [Jatrophihabitantaceae bacterium]|nr:hypothetical protein [Jatrophihabitantaceae bacterium]
MPETPNLAATPWGGDSGVRWLRRFLCTVGLVVGFWLLGALLNSAHAATPQPLPHPLDHAVGDEVHDLRQHAELPVVRSHVRETVERVQAPAVRPVVAVAHRTVHETVAKVVHTARKAATPIVRKIARRVVHPIVRTIVTPIVHRALRPTHRLANSARVAPRPSHRVVGRPAAHHQPAVQAHRAASTIPLVTAPASANPFTHQAIARSVKARFGPRAISIDRPVTPSGWQPAAPIGTGRSASTSASGGGAGSGLGTAHVRQMTNATAVVTRRWPAVLFGVASARPSVFPD